VKQATIIKFVLIFGLVASISLIIVLTYVPYHVESSRNTLTDGKQLRISPQTQALHKQLFIADAHADSLLWNRDLLHNSSYGHIDLPRMRQGNLGLQIFSIVSKTPRHMNLIKNTGDTDNITALAMVQAWPPRTWTSLAERALYQSQRLTSLSKRDGALSLITSAKSLNDFIALRRANPNQIAGLLSIEGAQALENELSNLERFYKSGIRIIGLAHLFDTTYGGSAHGEQQYGLTKQGKRLIREIDARHMIIDLAHSSQAVFNDVMAQSDRAVIVSHTGVYATCPSPRNLTDSQLRQVAASGGLIGIGFWTQATCGNDVMAITRSLRHAVSVVGIDHVALGSDMDGSVGVPFDAANYIQLTEAMRQQDFSEQEIRAIMGENLLRFLQHNLPAE